MDIGEAVRQLQDGKKVRRSGWNGIGMWLVYVPKQSSVVLKEGSPYAQAGLKEAAIDAHIDMHTSKGTMQPGWLCSQADLLATDWELA